jgi:5'-3' exonuclease
MEAGSPLAHLYPSTFEQDLNGAQSWWKALALLPFIDRQLLRQHLEVGL